MSTYYTLNIDNPGKISREMVADIFDCDVDDVLDERIPVPAHTRWGREVPDFHGYPDGSLILSLEVKWDVAGLEDSLRKLSEENPEAVIYLTTEWQGDYFDLEFFKWTDGVMDRRSSSFSAQVTWETVDLLREAQDILGGVGVSIEPALEVLRRLVVSLGAISVLKEPSYTGLNNSN